MAALRTLLVKVRAAGCRREYMFLPIADQHSLGRLLAAHADTAQRVRAALMPPSVLQAGAKRARH